MREVDVQFYFLVMKVCCTFFPSWFWYQGNTGFTEWVEKHSSCSISWTLCIIGTDSVLNIYLEEFINEAEWIISLAEWAESVKNLSTYLTWSLYCEIISSTVLMNVADTHLFRLSVSWGSFGNM